MEWKGRAPKSGLAGDVANGFAAYQSLASTSPPAGVRAAAQVAGVMPAGRVADAAVGQADLHDRVRGRGQPAVALPAVGRGRRRACAAAPGTWTSSL